MSPSPTAEGLRAVFRRPALIFAEIAWRWTFGTAAIALLTFTVVEYLNSLPVTSGEQLFLRSRQPFLISQAIAQIFKGSATRLAATTLISVAALAIFWIFAAAVGRAATLQPLFDYFDFQRAKNSWKFRSLLGLNFLRVSLGFACVIAFPGAAIVAGLTSSPANPSPGIVFLVFATLACIIALLWSTLNWYISVATLFVVRDGEHTFGAIAASIQFARGNASPVFWSSTVFGLLHFLVFAAGSIVALVPMAFTTVLPAGIVAIAITLTTLIYFGLVDFLYISRLAAYVAILQPQAADNAAVSAFKDSPPDTSHPAAPIPCDDDILSDIPGLLPPPEPAG